MEEKQESTQLATAVGRGQQSTTHSSSTVGRSKRQLSSDGRMYVDVCAGKWRREELRALLSHSARVVFWASVRGWGSSGFSQLSS